MSASIDIFPVRRGALVVLGIALLHLPPAGAQEKLPPAPYERSETQLSLYGQIDVSCILAHWQIVGAMVCSHGLDVHFCLIYQNPYPVGVVESVRRAGTTHVREAGAYLAGFSRLPLFGRTSSATTAQATGSAMQFSETHAWAYVPELGLSDTTIAKPQTQHFMSPAYFSELDGFFWRTPWADPLEAPRLPLSKTVSCSQVPRPEDCAGTWGPWYPRTGFLTHPSEVLASQLLGLRGGRIAADPGIRACAGKYPYEPRTGHFIQMIRPLWKPCASIGTPWVRPLEAGAGQPEGAYLYVHFGVFIECQGCFPALLQVPLPPL
jgi:hypothetical protein